MKAVLLLILLALGLSNVKTLFFFNNTKGHREKCNWHTWCSGALNCYHGQCVNFIDDINLNEQKDYNIDTADTYDYSLDSMIFVFVFGVTFGYVAFNLMRRRSS